ncbi:hypothetical protein ACQEU8_12475 [Streptomyces sp. CA-250714]|uniref:hypothetical protein n=1 Tax=Streptomyces sp. CA-250714 TaxID=3240060 RepID=UPI003D8A23B8
MTRHPAPGDPVRVLLHQHRALCERAVDPLEIAAGLEASGITDRTAARCRHRDVFSLAEELYARAPYPKGSTPAGSAPPAEHGVCPTGVTHTGSSPHADCPPGQCLCAPEAGSTKSAHDTRSTRRTAGWRLPAWCAPFALPLLPGLLCAGTLAWLALLDGGPAAVRAGLCALGAAAVLSSVIVAVRVVPRVPRSAGTSAFPSALFLCACWLTAYLLYGDWLLEQLLGGGPESLGGAPRVPSPAVPLGLALAVAPAVWCARGFALVARRRLAGSRSLGEFASGVRPLLVLAVCAVAVSLPALQWAARLLVDGPLAMSCASGVAEVPGGGQGPLSAWRSAVPGAGALGMLLFLALLLAAHGFRHAASAGLAVAGALEAAALLCVPAARLPGLTVLSRPVEALVAHQGAAAVPLIACGCAALFLLAYATTALAGASAHHREAVSA